MKKKLTTAQLAALAAGATMDAVLASAVPGDTPDESGGEPTDDDAQAALFAQNEQMVALAAELATVKAANEEVTTKLATAETELASAKASLEASTAASSAMSDTILGRVKNMSIALGTKAPDACEDPVALVALHTDLDKQFQEKFKTGRVSANTQVEAKAKPKWTAAQFDAARAIPVY